MSIHLVFDGLAWVSAALAGWMLWRWRLAALTRSPIRRSPFYALSGLAGLVLGAYSTGTLNMVVSGEPMIGRSVLGALAGAILGIELYKLVSGTRGTTGAYFVGPFALGVAIGRVGCFVTGLPDYTYGVASDVPWAVDFGDGVARHPVQLYEAGAMFVFFSAWVYWLARSPRSAAVFGFAAMSGYYATQRFLWEFLKPYGPVIGPLNVFHLVALGVVAFAMVSLVRLRRAPALG